MVKYCGADYLKALEAAASAEDTQYSYRNVLVAEVDGVAAGAVVTKDVSDNEIFIVNNKRKKNEKNVGGIECSCIDDFCYGRIQHSAS